MSKKSLYNQPKQCFFKKYYEVISGQILTNFTPKHSELSIFCSVFEGMLKTSISISRSIFFGLLVFQGLPISSLSYNFFVPRIGLLLPVVGLSLSVCSFFICFFCILILLVVYCEFYNMNSVFVPFFSEFFPLYTIEVVLQES